MTQVTKQTAKADKEPSAIPSPIQFLLKMPLYAKVSFEGSDAWNVLSVLYFNRTYDAFCPKCGRESTFQMGGPERPPEHIRNVSWENAQKAAGRPITYPKVPTGVHCLVAKCARIQQHTQMFFVMIEETVVNPVDVTRTMQKIGQTPSYGDLHEPAVKQYAPVLSRSQLAELTKASGLASHDVGVGAYVYLRRIFEGLIEEAHAQAVSDPGWDEVEYGKSRVADRISMLRSHLPEFLCEHPAMYSLLSKGIHELSEEECVEQFGTLRLGIEMILDEKLEAKRRADKIKDAKARLQKAISASGS